MFLSTLSGKYLKPCFSEPRATLDGLNATLDIFSKYTKLERLSVDESFCSFCIRTNSPGIAFSGLSTTNVGQRFETFEAHMAHLSEINSGQVIENVRSNWREGIAGGSSN